MYKFKILVLILAIFISKNIQAQIITTYAGTGSQGNAGDGGPATDASLNWPGGVATDATGKVYIADFWNARIRVVDPATGIISTFAGNGSPARSGDGGPASAAGINFPIWVTIDHHGNMYIACDSLTDPYTMHYVNSGEYIRKIDTAGIITTIAGNGTITHNGDGIPATSEGFYYIRSIAADDSGNLYIGNIKSRLQKINKFGIINTVAGTGLWGFSGDGGPASAATVTDVHGIAFDHSGNIFFSDAGNNRIRKINHLGIINTIAGDTSFGYSGDGGPVTAAKINYPSAMAMDDSGNIFFSDLENYLIRKISHTGIITTVAGNRTHGFSGDGGPADSAQINMVYAIALDQYNNMYLADVGNEDIRMVCAHCSGEAVPSIPEKNYHHLLITPNPNSGTFSFSLPYSSAMPVQVTISDIFGRLIKEFTTTTNKETPVTISAPPGIYFLTSVSEAGRQTDKIFIH